MSNFVVIFKKGMDRAATGETVGEDGERTVNIQARVANLIEASSYQVRPPRRLGLARPRAQRRRGQGSAHCAGKADGCVVQ